MTKEEFIKELCNYLNNKYMYYNLKFRITNPDTNITLDDMYDFLNTKESFCITTDEGE